MATPYTPLLYHSNYGVGGSDFKTLFEHLDKYDLKSCGLVDITFFGLHEFVQHSKDYGIKPIIGISAPFIGKDRSKSYLIVQNEEGYRNLCKIITKNSFGIVDLDYVKEHTAGIILLSNSLRILKEIGPLFSSSYYLLFPYRAVINKTFPAVAVNEIFYVKKHEKTLYKLMCAIKDNQYEHRPGTPNHLLKEEEFFSFFILAQQIQTILHQYSYLFLRACFGITADKRFGARWSEENPIILG